MKLLKDIKKAVITHKTPDFDALASACAACVLHGCDAVLTVTSFEANVEDYFNEEEVTLPVIRLKEKEFEEIKSLELLVVTDCKLAERTAPLEWLLKKADKIIMYDHHPSHGRDIEADETYVDETGSTVTIIIRKMKETGFTPDKPLATLMMLGLYEDTGLLSFSSTTAEDILAGAFLLESGADLELISEYVKRDMSKEQIFILNELLVNMNVFHIQGASVGLSYATTDRYIGEIAVIAHRIMDMESMDALFVAVRAGERIVLVGRSRADEIDCSVVMERFGGGGHSSAASAIVKKMTLTECVDLLKIVISENIHPVRLAKDIMNSPVKTVPITGTFEMAMDLFMKYNLNMMPVVDNAGLPVGLISRRDILQGIKHGLDGEPVRSLMQIEFRTVEPDVPYYLAEEMMLSLNQKMLPVVHEGRLKGVITRTDLLRLMHEEITKLPRHQQSKQAQKLKNISSLVKTCLPDRVSRILEDIGRLAESMGLNAYLVGGVVRDILMQNTNMDIDIVVEGDAPALAKRFAAMKKAKVSEHFKFKTAVVIFRDGFRVDFATSRTEYYTNPASAPEVENASIRNDLYRRDFSINAMAVKLTGDDFGLLLDFFGGQKDIIDKKIRVLHSLSFVDDPSRCLRGVRFAVRYGFAVGPHTEKLLKHAVSLKLLERVVGQRMYLELKYILSEDSYVDALLMMKKYDMLKFFHEKLAIDDFKLDRFAVLKKINGWYSFQFEDKLELWISRFCILFADLNRQEMKRLASRFEITGRLYDELADTFYKFKHAVWQVRRLKDVKASAITGIFEGMKTEAVTAAVAVLGQEYEWLLKEYLTVYRFVTPSVDGNDLKSMGIPPSGIYGEILKEIKRAKLDHEISSKEEELDLAERIARERGIKF
ncbi:CBS domain-containing protein [Geovibrio thiophilus]|uniref:CBS domain-containing protein n=1 Tax=Geovibrio thiophilus TaxID=139438 RepID=A0A410JYH1_9BACT|nr:CBS domain-containing protein [Geovibrio thiophilus]QAR33227.1 CBS domain-containing protein [Geovibrio thiophilus]